MSRKFRNPVFWGLSLLAAVLMSCSPDHPTSLSRDGNSKLGSSHRIAAEGTIFHLGSSDAQSSPEERTGWTRFAHDYWLDTTEVVQAEYQNLTGRNPAPLAARVGLDHHHFAIGRPPSGEGQHRRGDTGRRLRRPERKHRHGITTTASR